MQIAIVCGNRAATSFRARMSLIQCVGAGIEVMSFMLKSRSELRVILALGDDEEGQFV